MSEINTEIVGKVIEGYKVIKPLGQGKFSTVYQAERQIDQKLVALKIIKIFDMMDQKQREKCLQEVKLLQSVDHPNIVKYLDSFICENELYIAIEWADKGDLKILIKKYNQEGDKIEEFKIIDYTRQLGSALNHMHEKRIIHRDLKPANILIFSDGNLKLGDLGLGRYMSDETFKAFSKVGTPLYMSPEVIRNDGYDFKSDVWSLGCVIYELITFKSPFRTDEKISLFDLFNKINKGDYPHINDEKYSNIIKDLVDKMLKVNPDERISLEDVIKNCELILKQQDEKPKIDPFIVMEDICEKLRLIDYENTFCKKYKKELISKFFFATQINISNKKLSLYNMSQDKTAPQHSQQFMMFYELSYWLMLLIKQNVKLEILQEYDIKFKKFDKKRTVESQLNDLLNDLKQLGVKIMETSKFQNGYGEGVCLILTQLLDKYLINQNYIFKKPKFIDNQLKLEEEIQNDFEEIILEENTNNNDKNLTQTQNHFALGGFNTNFYYKNNNSGRSGGKKRFNSAISNYTQDTNPNSAFSTETENFKVNPFHLIMEANIDPLEWRKEFERVEKLLEIPEYPEFLISGSDNSNICEDVDLVNKVSKYSFYFEKNVNNKNLFILQNIYEAIDIELKQINLFEKVISESDKVKNKIEKFQKNYKKIKQIQTDINIYQERISITQNKIEEYEENVKILDEKENNITDDPLGFNSQCIKIKESISNIKKEINDLEIKNSIFGSSIFQNTQNYIKKKETKHKKDYSILEDTVFEEVL